MLNASGLNPALATGGSANIKGNHRHRLPNLQTKLATKSVASSKGVPEKPHLDAPRKGQLVKVVMVFCLVVATLVGCAHLIARYSGAQIARAGHTIKTQLRTVIIGQDVIKIPENMIRYPSQRKLAELQRLDLYLHWPSMGGYSAKLKAVFNKAANNKQIIFVSLEPRFSTLDMTGRIEPIYKQFFIGEATKLGQNLVVHHLDAAAGFVDEASIIQNNSPYPFSARCIMNMSGTTTPYCMRDIHIGNNLSLTYRFHKDLLTDWLALDRALRNKFKAMIN